MAGVAEEDFANSELFYQMGRPPGRVDILMSITGMDFDSAWSHRVEAIVDDVQMPFVSKDDLIASKIAAGRPQDLNDVRTLQLPVRSPKEFQQARDPEDPLSEGNRNADNE